MGSTLSEKILREHLLEGELVPGKEIGIKIDQTLTQDATGTLAYLQFEAMGFERVKTKLSVSYVDHNMLQEDFKNADDHAYLQSVAARYGIWFSRPGNGICHQVHLERFAKPGETLLGSDSHTPTAGGLAMVAIGAGGLDVAVAMGGDAFYFPCPQIVGVKLRGYLKPWVSPKDVILELLRRLTVKGGIGKAFEYFGDGISAIDVPGRSTITNMGAELGATFSIFPSDENSRYFLRAQNRESDFLPLYPDRDAEYAEVIEINLEELTPLIALPHMPDNVVPVTEVAGTKVDQVCIGSCTNSSYRDMQIAAEMLRNKHVAKHVSFTVTPGSKQVLQMMADGDALYTLVSGGARILESACGPCIGMGQAPRSGAVSLRTFNRNFEGRSGTRDAKVYLCSVEVAVASAIAGEITDPRTLGEYPAVGLPEEFLTDDSDLIPPLPEELARKVEIIRGPNIIPLGESAPLPEKISGKVLLKVGDNITTDHILPAGAKVLPFRSNIPKISEFLFERIDPTFYQRAKEAGGGFVVGGMNYGQGSSREHAGLAPAFVGIKAKIAKNFARIHRANLINFGVLPLSFENPADYERIEQGDELEIEGVREKLKTGEKLVAKNISKGFEFALKHDLSPREIEIVLAGGKLNYTKAKSIS